MKNVHEYLIPQIILQGKTYTAREAELQGLELTQTAEDENGVVFLKIRLENHSGRGIRLDKLNWHREENQEDFLSRPGLLLYLEGWQMASPCGVRGYGDCDYHFGSSYLQYAVAEPEDYSALPNHFRADNMMMFRDPDTSQTLLMGFVTTGDQFGHFKTELSENGVLSLDVRSSCDGMLVEDGETVCSETLALLWGRDGYALQCRYASLLGRKMGARTEMDPPVGWCSWYYYFDNVTGEDIRRNVGFLKENQDRFPMRYIQLDDGYQRALGDWLICNEKFPGGLKAVADTIREGGFIPALWLAPFLAEENSILLQEHPEWMIHDPEGNVIMKFPWRGHQAAVLDGTHPEVQAHFRSLFAQIRKLGFDYVKLDFMMTAASVREGVLADPGATRAQALRRGLEAIREGFGEDGYILGCTVPFGPVIGLVDGERISTDITPYWAPDREVNDEAPTVPNVCRNVIRHTYMNKRLWNNDPDTLIVRDDNTELQENEVRLWYEIVRLTGGMLMMSDNFPTLSADRSRLIEKLLKEPQAYDARPVDFWTKGVCSVLEAVHKKSGAVETALFNFRDERETVRGRVLEPHSCVVL
ncbi:MAG: alpha-galactosidase [Lachnospiraceae bacterium]|nr:alpha-galactosidase [Lachnospiraceae bacterium]